MMAQMQNDPTAPPTAGGLFPSIGGPGVPNPLGPPAAAPALSTAPPENEPFMLGDTTFSTESSSNVKETPSSSWWPFSS